MIKVEIILGAEHPLSDSPANMEITCVCGVVFLGRCKLQRRDNYLVRLLDRECPGCGDKVDVRKVSSGRESMTLTKGDVGNG